MEETYIFIANKPNPEYLLVDDRNLENFEDDKMSLTLEEKMYFYIDDDYKQEMKYSTDQVDYILKGTEYITEEEESKRDTRSKKRNRGSLPTANTVAPRYQIGKGEKRISDLMNLYEMSHCCAYDETMTCDYDNSHMYGYESHMYQRKISPMDKNTLDRKLREKGFATGIQEVPSLDMCIVKTTDSINKIKWIWNAPVDLPEEPASLKIDDVLEYQDMGYFLQYNPIWEGVFQEMTDEILKKQGLECFKNNDNRYVDTKAVFGSSSDEMMKFDPQYHHQNPRVDIAKKFCAPLHNTENHCAWIAMAQMVHFLDPDMADQMIKDMEKDPDKHQWLGFKSKESKDPKKNEVIGGATLFYRKPYGNQGVTISRSRSKATDLDFDNVVKSYENGTLREDNERGLLVGFIENHCVGLDLMKKIIFDPNEKFGFFLNRECMTKISKKDIRFEKIHGLYHVKSNTSSACKKIKRLGKSICSEK